jgi:urease beta subunit
MLAVTWEEIIENPSFRVKKAGAGCVQIGAHHQLLDVNKRRVEH